MLLQHDPGWFTDHFNGFGRRSVVATFYARLASQRPALFCRDTAGRAQQRSRAGCSPNCQADGAGADRNPIILGLAAGIVFNLLPVSLPPLLNTTLERFGAASLPCALFVLGASLTRYKIAGHLREAWTLVGLKMVVQPLLVALLAFGVFRLDPLWGAVAVMAAGMPVGVNAYIMAQKYETGVATLSTAVLLTTLFAVVSQSVFLAIFL